MYDLQRSRSGQCSESKDSYDMYDLKRSASSQCFDTKASSCMHDCEVVHLVDITIRRIPRTGTTMATYTHKRL